MSVFFLSLIFLGFLYPVDIEGVSVNYSFLLLPVFLIFRNRKLYTASNTIGALIILYILIFFLGALWSITDTEHGIRRMQSFLIFMTIFVFAFIQIDKRMINAFKWALICISCAFSFSAIAFFFFSGGNLLGYEAKDVVGSQRYGFVFLLAFSVIFFLPIKSKLQKMAQIGGLVVLFVGLMLTFSRASIVAFLSSSSLYILYILFQWIKRPRLKNFMKGILGALGVFAVAILLAYLFPIVFEFFDDRIIGRLFTGRGEETLLDPETSEGFRVEMLRNIWMYVLHNPLTGSGYLGVWILSDSIGSAHNQYTDSLFRTGFIGFLAYLYLIYRLLPFLWLQHRDLFWGFVGILIYGLFHETFKESHGAFLLAFLIGMHESYLRAIPKVWTTTRGHIKSDTTSVGTL